MPRLLAQLDLGRCPHCNVDTPTLVQMTACERTPIVGDRRYWKFYSCRRCGGVVTASSDSPEGDCFQMFPSPLLVDEAIDETASEYLKQAIGSQSAPAGAVMLAASSVDAMLKAKNYTEGSLYSRINKAKDDHLITDDMAEWAHEVRLDANDPRHADEEHPLPSPQDASRVIEFTMALAEFIFVLPNRVTRGRNATEVKPG